MRKRGSADRRFAPCHVPTAAFLTLSPAYAPLDLPGIPKYPGNAPGISTKRNLRRVRPLRGRRLRGQPKGGRASRPGWYAPSRAAPGRRSCSPEGGSEDRPVKAALTDPDDRWPSPFKAFRSSAVKPATQLLLPCAFAGPTAAAGVPEALRSIDERRTWYLPLAGAPAFLGFRSPAPHLPCGRRRTRAG